MYASSGQYQVVLEETVFIKVEDGLTSMEDDPLEVRPSDLTRAAVKVKNEFIPKDETNTGKNDHIFEFPEGLKREIKVEEVDLGAEDCALVSDFVSSDSDSSNTAETEKLHKAEILEEENKTLHVSDDRFFKALFASPRNCGGKLSRTSLVSEFVSSGSDSSNTAETEKLHKAEILKEENKTLHVSDDRFFKALFASQGNCGGKLSPTSTKEADSIFADSKPAFASKSDNEQLSTKSEGTTLRSDEKLFSCALCAAKFPQKLHLKSHYSTLHPNAKPHSCPMCAAVFKTSREVRLHSFVHTEERPFACSLCDGKFKTQAYLKKHEVIHSQRKKPFACMLCPATFRFSQQLKQHSAMHAEGKMYPCLFCTARFFKPKELKTHSVTFHSDEKPFSCMLCHATFKTLPELRTHSAIHSGKKQCSRTYVKCRYV